MSRRVGVVGTLPGEAAEAMPALVLQGHLDVVPPGDPENWLGSNPFSAEIRDGSLFGRGACDMKAGVAANLAVLRTLRDAGVRLERPLAVHCVIGEEDGGLGGFATLRRGHIGEAAVITEPTSARIITATAGALTFRIEVAGRSAHGSMRKEGVSAFEAFLPIHAALLQFEADRNRDPDPRFTGDTPYALSRRHRADGRVVEQRARPAGRRGPLRGADRRGPATGEGALRGRRDRGRRQGPLAAAEPAGGDVAGWPVRQRQHRHRPPARRRDVGRGGRDRRRAARRSLPVSTAATCGSTPATAASRRCTTGPATSRKRTRRWRRSTSTSWSRSPARSSCSRCAAAGVTAREGGPLLGRRRPARRRPSPTVR